MALAGKVKTALDETRTLILGAQILLGFQCQGAFRPQFDSLPTLSRRLSAVALVLMLLSLGLLVAPSAFHRIADGGESTGRMHRLTGMFAGLALLPFAIALGLDLTLTLDRAWGGLAAGATAGALLAITAVIGWYGAGVYMRRTQGARERAQAIVEWGQRDPGPLHARIEQMLTEARVILPGAQALLGFQLVIVLSSAFDKLPPSSRAIHGFALIAVTLATVLLITPAALHRIVWAGEESEAFLRLGGRITVLALLPLAFGMTGDTYVVLARTMGTMSGAITAGVSLLFLLAFWFGIPLVGRAIRQPQPVPANPRNGQI
jgi:uncharacterized membrane protein